MRLVAAILFCAALATPLWAQGLATGDVERDKRYEQRFIDLERALAREVSSIKDATANALAAQDKQVSAQIQSTKDAIGKADAATEKRFDSVNEFRNTLKDQQSRFIDKSEMDVRNKALSDRVDELKAVVNRLSARQDSDAARREGEAHTWGMIAGGLGLMIGLIAASAGVASFLRRAKESGTKTA